MDAVMQVIQLNQIIQNAQNAIQQGKDMEDVWRALYVPKVLRHPVTEKVS